MKPSTLLTCMNALSRFAFMATVIVLPFFFIPFSSVNAGALKGALLFIGITISVLAYAIARFIDGELSFPKTRINLALMFVLIVTLVSAIFSPAFYKSMFGLSFEMGTFASILVLVLVYFLGVHHVVKDRSRKIIVRGLFVSFFASFAIIVASFFLSSNQVFVNVFKGISGGTLVGSWSEYGIFSAVIVLLSLFYSALVKNSLIKKIFYWISIAMGLLVLALVNIILLWVTVGVFSLIFFVYTVSLSHKPGVVEYSEKQTKLPVTAFLVVVVCILFTVGNSVVGTVVSSKLGYVSDFAQPSIASNALVYKMQSAGNPLRSILGVGPARFTEAWMHFKPVEVNNTAYWDTAFYSGFGTIMTMLVTTGALGFISWIFFLLIYFVTGIRVLTSQLKTENFDSGLVITFIVSAFLWVVNLLIVSNVTIFVMTFTMTTLFVGALISRNIVEVPRNTYLKDPRNSFFAILLLVCIMIGSIVSLYFSSVKLVSIVYFTKATNATSVESAQTYVQHAIQLQNKNDNYYRTLSSLYLNQLGTLLSKDKNTPNLQTNVQGLLNAAQQSSTQAVSIDSNNYSNWLSLGQFFQSATMLQAEGDPYKNGVTSYEKAAYFVPNSPAIPLAQARLELANKNIPAAQDFITKSLSLKKGYVAGYQLRAQIAFDAKDYKESINQLSQAIVLNPQVSDLYVSRGMLYNQTGAYVDAANDFRMAFNLNSNPNTAYLLAQADIKINAFEEATTIIDALVKANPDNADIKDLKDKLQQAKNPTPVVQPTTDTKKVETKK